MPRVVDLSSGSEIGLAALGAGLAGSANTGRRVRNEEREQDRADQRLDLAERQFSRGKFESDRGFAESTRRFDQGFERGVFESDRAFDANREDAAFQKQMQDKQFEQQIQQFSFQQTMQKAQHGLAEARVKLSELGLNHQIDQDRSREARFEAQRLAATEAATERVVGLQAAGIASPEVLDGLTSLIEAGQSEQAIELANGIAFDHFQRQAQENLRARQAAQFMAVSQDSVGASGYDQRTHETLSGMVQSGFIEPAQATLYMLQRTNPELFTKERSETAPEGASRARGGAPEGYTRVRTPSGDDIDIPQSAMAPEGGGELDPNSAAYSWWKYAASAITPPEKGQRQKDYDALVEQRAKTMAEQYGGWGGGPTDAAPSGSGQAAPKGGAAGSTGSRRIPSNPISAAVDIVFGDRSKGEQSGGGSGLDLPQGQISQIAPEDFTPVIDQIIEKYPRVTPAFVGKLLEQNPDMTLEEFMSKHQKQFKNR